MHLHVTQPVKNGQYANHTFSFAVNEDIEVGIIQLERVIENLLITFQSHHMYLNATKTEVSIFSKKIREPRKKL